MTQRDGERPPIAVQHARRRRARWPDRSVRAADRALPRSSTAHIIGVVVSETTSEITMAIGDRHGEFAEQLADQAAHQQDRDKHRDQRHAHRQHREADLAGSQQRGLQRRLSCIQVAGDVFQHDDGVVDHESGRDRERHQREDVEAVSEQIHHRECRDQRHRYRHHGHQRRPRAAQEREHDEDHQNHGDDQRDFDVPQRGPDRRSNGRPRD